MARTIYDVLQELRESATSEADKGAKLERLVAAYLRTDPVYADQFSDVWLWTEWPGNSGKHDTGIDLVARDGLTGGLVAIQCKFFAPTTTVSKPMIDTFLAASGKEGFAERIIVSTTDRWNGNAEDALKGQAIPVRRVGLSDLEHSLVDWDKFSLAAPDRLSVRDKKTARPHQLVAIDKVTAGFGQHDRGKLIMACGTGKTFTSLRLAEQNVGTGGKVLFITPSISLLSQTLREWVSEANLPIRGLAVCSDAKSTKRSANLDEDISVTDLALPATTKIETLRKRIEDAEADTASMTVVFATYQSIGVVAAAQKDYRPFDLIIADEAHRTTGTTLSGEDESTFVRVHDNNYVSASKRLYMTATPRIYDDTSKAKAGEVNAVLASMDDETVFGPELHRLGFGEAVSRDLLTDYKVLVLAVDETAVSRTFQLQLADEGNELRLDDAAKIVGCWNGLAKRGSAEHSFEADPAPMRRAVAFAGTINASKQIESLFAQTVKTYAAAHDLADRVGDPVLACEIQHVDGTFNALERNTRLDWLRADVPDGTCRILTNARCLSEGVDVPALDAVMFLSPRKSVVDIVQSVGRVMRKADGKNYGYIILPIGIPAGMTPEQALRDNKRYAAVWEVLQALRAHDERFNAMVNRISLVKQRDNKVNIIGVPGPGGDRGSPSSGSQGALALTWLDEWRDAIYAKVVAKVGSRTYWEDWAKDVANIAQRHITRITALLDGGHENVTEEFGRFLHGLRGNLNEGITRGDAVDMLAQHLITRPVFDALFGGYDFAAHNPVAEIMEKMLTALDEHSLDNENQSLEKFYESVRQRVQGIDNSEGRQKIITELYETFFATAFKRTVDKLGIVYTPVEIVDFIVRSADEVLRKEFGKGLTDPNVHILDGFTGTGTFMVRLIQSGLIAASDLPRKYAVELHANEILLLAYYIAAVNIESAYHDAKTETSGDLQEYEPFSGLILTDTFQSWEDDDRLDLEVFRENNARLERLKKLPITVIVGNPPYSSGQDSANDENANEVYPSLDKAIRTTYAERSGNVNKVTLYDSYIRAIKWASLRVRDRGVIAYVTNGGWLDSNTADGMRKSLAEEFSAIYVYNLRGNQRTAGEQSRKEGGKVFGGASRATVAITILVRDRRTVGPATIHYTEVDDYLSREQKLEQIAAAGSIGGLKMIEITPNAYGDWISQRAEEYMTFITLGDKRGADRVFSDYSGGLSTARDSWNFGSARRKVEGNVQRLIQTYEIDRRSGVPSTDLTQISWSTVLRALFQRNRPVSFNPAKVATATYRPFFRQWAYFDSSLIHSAYQLPRIFPSVQARNIGIFSNGFNAQSEPAFLMLDSMPSLDVFGKGGQFFARWRFELTNQEGALTFDIDGEDAGGYRQIDNITDQSLAKFHLSYDARITKDDIFYYVYGLLHSPIYRETYSSDLKKMLPRVPLVTDPWPYVEAGRALSELHLSYESIEPFPLDGLNVEPSGDSYDFFRVEKMTFAKVLEGGKRVRDRSEIIYNSRIRLRQVPEGAYRYMLGSRSAIEWIIDRYQVKTDPNSGITNDPNDWSYEAGNPRYILDLVARIVTVSLETMRIVDSLPVLEIKSNA